MTTWRDNLEPPYVVSGAQRPWRQREKAVVQLCAVA
jgi:hypothetical protein